MLSKPSSLRAELLVMVAAAQCARCLRPEDRWTLIFPVCMLQILGLAVQAATQFRLYAHSRPQPDRPLSHPMGAEHQITGSLAQPVVVCSVQPHRWQQAQGTRHAACWRCMNEMTLLL